MQDGEITGTIEALKAPFQAHDYVTRDEDPTGLRCRIARIKVAGDPIFMLDVPGEDDLIPHQGPLRRCFPSCRVAPSQYGLGVFATAAIKKGTMFFSEKPLLVAATETDAELRFERLPLPTQLAVLGLNDPESTADDNEFLQHIGGVNRREEKTAGSIYNNNALPHSHAEPQYCTSGLYENGSRFNHSCCPNVCYDYNAERKEMEFVALEDIPEGEEMTLSYTLYFFDKPSERQATLRENFYFDCICPLCRGTATEAQRERYERGLNVAKLHKECGGSKSGALLVQQAKDGLELCEGDPRFNHLTSFFTKILDGENTRIQALKAPLQAHDYVTRDGDPTGPRCRIAWIEEPTEPAGDSIFVLDVPKEHDLIPHRGPLRRCFPSCRVAPSQYGLGVFATAAIKKGTMFFSEKPLLVAATETDAELRFERLPLPTQLAVLGLNDPESTADDNEFLQHIGGVNRREEKTAGSIYNNNSLPHSHAQPQNCPAGLYETGCRFNHACSPNVCYNYTLKRKEMEFVALEDIPEGEELTITYLLDFFDRPSDRRGLLKKNFYFDCVCSMCRGAATEAQRERYERGLKVAKLHKELKGRLGSKTTALLAKQAKEGLELCEGDPRFNHLTSFFTKILHSVGEGTVKE